MNNPIITHINIDRDRPYTLHLTDRNGNTYEFPYMGTTLTDILIGREDLKADDVDQELADIRKSLVALETRLDIAEYETRIRHLVDTLKTIQK